MGYSIGRDISSLRWIVQKEEGKKAPGDVYVTMCARAGKSGKSAELAGWL